MVITWILTIISVLGVCQLQSLLWWKKARTARTCIITITSINKYKAAIWIFINHEHNTWPLNTATISSLFTEVQLRLQWLGEKPECNGQGLSLSAWPVLSTGLQPLAGFGAPGRRATVLWKQALRRWPGIWVTDWAWVTRYTLWQWHGHCEANQWLADSNSTVLRRPGAESESQTGSLAGGLWVRLKFKFHWQVLWVRRGNLNLNLYSECHGHGEANQWLADSDSRALRRLSQMRQLELELELWVKQPTWPPAGRR